MKTLAAVALIALSCITFNMFGQSKPHTVYVLPMAGGLDQYLAQRLSSDHVMKVVADPKLADVVLTDRLGEAFEQKLADITAARIYAPVDYAFAVRRAFRMIRPSLLIVIETLCWPGMFATCMIWSKHVTHRPCPA